MDTYMVDKISNISEYVTVYKEKLQIGYQKSTQTIDF